MSNPNVPALFESPTVDPDRVQTLHGRVSGVRLDREDFGAGAMAVFPHGGKPNASGALIASEACNPCVQGSIVYPRVTDLAHALTRAKSESGDSRVPTAALPQGVGHLPQFRDCERNRVGLGSPA